MSRQTSASTSPAAPAERERDELARSLGIEELRLVVQSGVLFLDGRAPCYQHKREAGDAAARLPGVDRVVNRLRVASESHRRDAELADAVRASVTAHPALLREAIEVSVWRGVVTLEGRVSSGAARCEAERAVWAVGGLIDVRNRLTVQAVASANKTNGRHTPVTASCR